MLVFLTQAVATVLAIGIVDASAPAGFSIKDVEAHGSGMLMLSGKLYNSEHREE